MNKNCLLPALFFISPGSYAQKKKMPLFMDSLFVYKNLFTGGTTNLVSLFSSRADTRQGIIKIKVQQTDLDTLNLLLTSIPSKRHQQQKIGPTYYALACAGGERHRLSVIKSFRFIDMPLLREYSFRNAADSGMFSRFVERNYQPY